MYSVDQGTLIAEQLERFATLNVHQLAGHVANLDFWIGEALHALRTIDGHPARFSASGKARSLG